MGGWGTLLRYEGSEKTLKGFEANTTNNRMELMGAIEGLRALKRPCKVKVYTDSQYVKKGMTEWIFQWKANGWKNSSKKPVKNVDLWQMLDELSTFHHIEWHWVKGHAGHVENERADALANAAIEEYLSRG